MADIIDLDAVRKAKADEALMEALGRFESLIIMGWDKQDDLLVIWGGGELADPDIIFLIELVKSLVLAGEL
jgi:hypothetical protein